jgi:hypothetical protein
MGTQTVVVSFLPTRLGPHNEAMPLTVRPGNGVALGICLGVVAAFISSDGVQFLPLHEASIWRF